MGARAYFRFPYDHTNGVREVQVTSEDRADGSMNLTFQYVENGRLGDQVTHSLVDVFELLPRLRRFLEAQGA